MYLVLLLALGVRFCEFKMFFGLLLDGELEILYFVMVSECLLIEGDNLGINYKGYTSLILTITPSVS